MPHVVFYRPCAEVKHRPYFTVRFAFETAQEKHLPASIGKLMLEYRLDLSFEFCQLEGLFWIVADGRRRRRNLRLEPSACFPLSCAITDKILTNTQDESREAEVRFQNLPLFPHPDKSLLDDIV